MKKRVLQIIIIMAFCLSLAACGGLNGDGAADGAEASQATVDYAEHVLTKEQMLEDYDAMWAAMEENYPFWQVLERNGIDYMSIRAEYRKKIADMTLEGNEAMAAFIWDIAYSLYDVCGDVGHVAVVAPASRLSLIEVYQEYLEEMPSVRPWLEAADNPEVASFYAYVDYLFQEGYMNADGAEDENTEASGTEENAEELLPDEEEANLTTTILEEGKVAYIRVRSFDNSFMQEDLPHIRAFLEQVQQYQHLILDIQGNSGGDTNYWLEAFVQPNLSAPVTESTVRLMGNGALAQQFYGDDYADEQYARNMEEVLARPAFTALHSEDMDVLTMARELTEVIEPELDEKLFQGDIWLLVDEWNYSSAEGFAVFCKGTGFATLVGQTTGGSNSGGPILFTLPNSHLLIEFDVEYCLNPDGSCSQEMGTVPDIEAEDALNTVLDRIANN